MNLIILAIALIIICVFIEVMSDTFADLGVFLCCVGVVALVTLIVTGVLIYESTTDAVEQYYAVKQTIEDARNSDINEIELAALTQKIVEINQTLASARAWNESVFDIFINDKLAELPPLK